MKPRTLLLILLALVCGVSAAVGVNQLNQAAAPATTGDTVSVVLATQDIPRGEVLSAENCALRPWPKALLPEGAITEMDAAMDQSAVVPMVKGEPVLEGKVAGKGAGRGLAAMIEPGMRAFTIQTPQIASGVGGFIRPENRVDVLLTTRSKSRDDGSGGGATTTLLQNVKILAVDRRLESPEGSDVDEKDPRSVTLLVTPNQAAKLDLGMNMGMLHLSLRNPNDTAEAITRPATLAEIRYHQEKPLTNIADKASHLVGTVARAWASRDEGKEPQETTESEAAPKEPRYRSANIRTLRGASRGHIRIDTAN